MRFIKKHQITLCLLFLAFTSAFAFAQESKESSLPIIDYSGSISKMQENMSAGNYREVLRVYKIEMEPTAAECLSDACVEAYDLVSGAHMMLKELDNAKPYNKYMEAWLSSDPENKWLITKVSLTLAQSYVRQGQFSVGIPHIKKTIEVYNDKDYFTDEQAMAGLSKAYEYGANSYYMMEQYENAIEFYIKALGFQDGTDHADEAVLNHNIASSYEYLEQWDKAIHHAKISVDFSRKSKSEVFLAYANQVLAKSYAAKGLHAIALDGINESIAIFKARGDDAQTIESITNRANFFIALGDWGNALADVQTIEEILSEQGNDIRVNEGEVFEVSYVVYEHFEQTARAFDYHKRWASYSIDKLKKQQADESVRLMTEFETELSNVRADKMERQLELKALTIKKNEERESVMFWLIVVIIFCLVMMGLFFYRERAIKVKMSHLAMTDLLTGIPNRRSVILSGEKMVNDKRKSEKPLCVALIDLDYFKKINDTYGHDVGDEVLTNFANITKQELRDTDVLGRYGGEEFILLLPSTNEDDLNVVFDRISESLAQNKCLIDGKEIVLPISMSMGAVVIENVCYFDSNIEAAKQLSAIISKADELVYDSKASGRACLTVGRM